MFIVMLFVAVVWEILIDPLLNTVQIFMNGLKAKGKGMCFVLAVVCRRTVPRDVRELF